MISLSLCLSNQQNQMEGSSLRHCHVDEPVTAELLAMHHQLGEIGASLLATKAEWQAGKREYGFGRQMGWGHFHSHVTTLKR